MMSDSNKIVLLAAGVAMAIAALMPGGFRPDAWLFGVGLGIAQSLVGLRCYRIALARTSPAFGPALAGGFIRIAVLIIALAAALGMGRPAPPFIWALLSAYIAMMTAEIAIVARLARQPALEVR